MSPFRPAVYRPAVYGPAVYGPAVYGGPSSASPAVDSTTFRALSRASGAAALPADLTVNGVTVSPSARYEGAGLTGTDGTLPGVVGPTLSTTGAGASVASALSPYTGTDASVSFGNGKSLASAVSAAANTAFDLGANDFVLALVVQTTAATGGLIRKAATTPGAGVPGWQIALAPTSATLTISDGVTTKTLAATLLSGTYNAIVWYVDKSEASTNGGRVYVNGALNASADLSGIGTIASAAALSFGAAHTGAITYFSVHQASAWFAGGGANATQFLTSAVDTCSRLEGSRAEIALGTAVPTISTRSTAAYLDRVVSTSPFTRRLFFVGANWMRFCSRREIAGGEDISGAVQEAQATNLCLRSEEFDNASWTKTAATISANARAAPNGESTADGIIGSAAAAQHGVTQAITLTAASYLVSFFVEAGDQTFAYIENATIANGRVWFNLSTGVIGTRQAGITEGLIESYGQGRYRISARFTGTAAAHTIGLFSASADNTANYTGDAATVNLWAWGAQVELSPQDTLPSTYIPTTTASTTRTVDTLAYKTDDGNYAAGSPGQLSVDLLYTFSRAATNVHAVALIAASVAASGDYHDIRTLNTTGYAQVREAIASVLEYGIVGTTTIVDGEKHTITSSWATNEGKLLVDGVQQGATDTSVVVLPAAPAQLTLGNVTASAYQNALISNVRIRNTAAT